MPHRKKHLSNQVLLTLLTLMILKELDTFVEVIESAAETLLETDSDTIDPSAVPSLDLAKVEALVENIDEVVKVVEKAEEAGVKSTDNLESVINNADKAKDLNVVMEAAANAGVEDINNLNSVF